jgi:CMP-N,N'-diacetyllegionaminic acid synthase
MIQKNRYLAIIPARKGSKGLPNKNILPFNGIPLFLNTCNVLHLSKHEIDIFVSTDSEEIISLCKDNEVSFVKRPDEISADNSTTEDAINHLLSSVKLSEYDNIILAQCTSPLLTPSDVDAIIDEFESKTSQIDSLFTCYEDHFPIWNNEDNKLVRINHLEKIRQPRQKSESIFIENGALYVFKIKNYLETKSRFCGITDKYILSKYKSIDIDNLNDFKIAEYIKNNIDS